MVPAEIDMFIFTFEEHREMHQIAFCAASTFVFAASIACAFKPDPNGPLRYDPQTRTYTMTLESTDKKNAPSVVRWPSKNRIAPVVNSSVSEGRRGLYKYSYEFANERRAELTVTSIRHIPALSLAHIEGDRAVTFYLDGRRSIADLRAIEKNVLLPDGWYAAVADDREGKGRVFSFGTFEKERKLTPGTRAAGFVVRSDSLPGLARIGIDGSVPFPEWPDESSLEEGGRRELYHRWMDEDVVLVTLIAPSVRRPASLTVASAGEAATKEVSRWAAQKFTSKESADKLVTALNKIADSRKGGSDGKSAERDLDNLTNALTDLPASASNLLDFYGKLLVSVPLK
jgi:hypothetical protein